MMKSVLELIILALMLSVNSAEDVCVKSLGLVLDKDTGTCVSLCNESAGKVWNPKKGRCRKLCKKKQGLEFNRKKKECRSICGRVRLFNKDTKKCYCAGTNTNYKKKKDNCKCKKGFYEIKPDPDGNWRTLECTLAVPTSAPTPVVVPDDNSPPQPPPSATPSIAPSGLIPVETQQSVNFTTDGTFANMMSDQQGNEIGDLLCDEAMSADENVLSCEPNDIQVLPLAETGVRRRLSTDGRDLQTLAIMRVTVVVGLRVVFSYTVLLVAGFTRADVMNNNPAVRSMLDLTATLNTAATEQPFMATLISNTIVGPYFAPIQTFVVVAVTVLQISDVIENSEEPSAAPNQSPAMNPGDSDMSLNF